MNQYATVSTTDFPIINVTFTGEPANDENFLLYLREVKNSYDRQSKLAILFDATKAVFPGMALQKMQAQWLKDNTAMMQNYCVGTAYVIPNVVIRNVLKAIFLLQPQPVPYLVCDDKATALAWAQNQLNTL